MTRSPLPVPDLPEVLQALLPPELRSSSTRVTTRKGERLFRRRQRPTRMYFVVSGEVVLERLAERGEPVVLQRVRQGLVGEASLQSAAYHCDGVVTQPGRVVAMPIDGLKAALASDPAFAMRWIAMLGAEVRRLRAQCDRLSLKGVRERLLHLIETEGVGGRLAIDAGLKSVAAEIAVTHEALYRTVAALENEGRISRDGRSLALVRPAAVVRRKP
jgi:CRP-like cAMP-binding protein